MKKELAKLNDAFKIDTFDIGWIKYMAYDGGAFNILMPHALKGNPKAMRAIGRMYETGLGVTVDHSEGVRWYRKAVDAGDARAMNNLGYIYYNNNNYSKAYHLFMSAVTNGETICFETLGWMYENGLGVTKDNSEAVRWYRKGAEAGDGNAMNNLGAMYQNGDGVSRDRNEAKLWYQRAIENSNTSDDTRKLARENLRSLGY
jgi:TPR repeat protein